MKKTIICVLMLTLIGSCAVLPAMATPEITGVRGGYGVAATVVDADGFDWEIKLTGTHILIVCCCSSGQAENDGACGTLDHEEKPGAVVAIISGERARINRIQKALCLKHGEGLFALCPELENQ